ncbi:hypothetical protein ACNKHX_16945 [Shigella flexneri]
MPVFLPDAALTPYPAYKPIKFNELKNDVDLMHSTTGYFAF